ncbi:MAG: hypothetical protein ACM3Q1_02085, partial [Bacteroidales bacterium]
DADEVADALAKALTMPRPERLARWRLMMDVIEANTVETWRDAFLADLTAGMDDADDALPREDAPGIEAPPLPLAPVAQPPGYLR